MSHVKIVILILKNCLVIHILCFELNTFKKYDVPRGGGGGFSKHFLFGKKETKKKGNRTKDGRTNIVNFI